MPVEPLGVIGVPTGLAVADGVGVDVGVGVGLVVPASEVAVQDRDSSLGPGGGQTTVSTPPVLIVRAAS